MLTTVLIAAAVVVASGQQYYSPSQKYFAQQQSAPQNQQQTSNYYWANQGQGQGQFQGQPQGQSVVHPNQPANAGLISAQPASSPEQQNRWDATPPVVVRTNSQRPQQYYYVISNNNQGWPTQYSPDNAQLFDWASQQGGQGQQFYSFLGGAQDAQGFQVSPGFQQQFVHAAPAVPQVQPQQFYGVFNGHGVQADQGVLQAAVQAPPQTVYVVNSQGVVSPSGFDTVSPQVPGYGNLRPGMF